MKELLTKSQTTQDKRSWHEVMKDYPQVRKLLYTSSNLMRGAAEGASGDPPPVWHASLLSLLKRWWDEEEAQAIAALIVGFMNDDFLPREKEAI